MPWPAVEAPGSSPARRARRPLADGGLGVLDLARVFGADAVQPEPFELDALGGVHKTTSVA